jgi:hypothetical protein
MSAFSTVAVYTQSTPLGLNLALPVSTKLPSALLMVTVTSTTLKSSVALMVMVSPTLPV